MYKYSINRYYLKLFFFIAVYLILNVLVLMNTEAQEEINANQLPINKETASYSEVFLDDEQTPLFLFGREILSSNDMLECSSQQDIDHILQSVIEREPVSHASRSVQPTNIETEQSQLLGFPLKALSKPLMLGGMFTGFSYPDLLSKDTYDGRFSQHLLRNLSMDAQVRLKSSNERCFLDFLQCDRKNNCIFDDEGQIKSYMKIPVLGISQKHQAVIMYPNELGNQLTKVFLRIQNGPLSLISNFFSAQASQVSIVDFSKSNLVFDIINTLRVHPWHYRRYPHFANALPPQVISRWFIRFGLEAENDFIGIAPTEGVEYLTTNSAFSDDVFIYRQNISPETPVHFYLKNFPDEHKEPIRQAFQHWDSIHVSLEGYPALSYTFIQGDYDGQKEIIIGDVRYNVMEWSNNIFPKQLGFTSHHVDQETGEILSVATFIQGAYLINEYSKWFEYSDMIRAGEVVRDESLIDELFRNVSFNLISQVDIRSFPSRLQVHFLAPERETIENHIFNVLKYSSAHEIGHVLGLGHNYRTSTFMEENILYSVMDYIDIGGNYNFRYETALDNYDKMAIAYGYSGILPEYTDRSCSDNEVGPFTIEEQKTKSPECSKIDATDFPLEYAANRLKDILDLLMRRKDDQSFPYLILNREVELPVRRLLFIIVSYHFSADTQYNQLNTILIDGRKPKNPQEVKDLVIEYLTPILCDPRLSHAFNSRDASSTVFDRYLHNNAIQFKRLFHQNLLSLTDIDTISCSDSRLTFERDN